MRAGEIQSLIYYTRLSDIELYVMKISRAGSGVIIALHRVS